jgi:hypothetical protein
LSGSTPRPDDDVLGVTVDVSDDGPKENDSSPRGLLRSIISSWSRSRLPSVLWAEIIGV